MYFWSCFLYGFLAIAVSTLAQEDDVSDTLLSALDAVSRRQRDLANAEGAYYGLGPYREGDEEGAYAIPEREASVDGQPENIGYGFQKSIVDNGPQVPFAAPGLVSMSQPNEELIQKLAIEYLENEFQNDNDANQYYRPGFDAKRSAFRERDLPERYSNVLAKSKARKRNNGAEHAPSSFRERSHNDRNDENKRRRFMATINRRIGHEQEDPISENEEEYPQMLQTLWERYRESNPNVVDVEDLSEHDVEEILNILGEDGENGNDVSDSEMEKRYGGGGGGGGGGGYGYGGSYDFFNHGAAMNGGMGFKKRNKQRLDENNGAANAFLYSLKFVAPEYNREAVEQLRENEGMEIAGENDEDIVRVGLKNMEEPEGRGDQVWFPAAELEKDDPDYFLKGDISHPSQAQEERARKRLAMAGMHHHSGNNMDKRYLYDRALLKRKRFPVAKRSSSYYTSPVALHHQFDEATRTKKDVKEQPATDPKVASELSQIFSPSTSNDNTIKIAPQIIGNHVVTKQKVVTSTTTPSPRATNNSTNIEVTVVVNQYLKKNETVIEDKPNDEEMELPVIMSRLEVPIEVKKKSIDWTDYFGLDRRRKKTGSSTATAKSTGNAINDAWLINQYYNALALSPDAIKRTVFRGNRNDEMMHKKDSRFTAQPFDTRIYDANILHKGMRSGAAKKNQASQMDGGERMENMDSKLRNIEDLIVNEAVKYTGAHEGTTDSREIQEVKDKVMSRLAAAYNLEKMRKALGEFKSSMAAQKMSPYNPENRATQEDNADEKKKRIAVKKEKADLKEMRASKAKKVAHEEEGFAEFLETPVAEALTSGNMGYQGEHLNSDECPILTKIVTKCRNAETGTGDTELHFLSMCTLHQICYICGPEVGADGPSTCDGMYLSQADVVCNGDVHCEKSALRAMIAIKHQRQTTEALDVSTQCWENFCAAQYVMNPAVANQS